MFSGGQDSLRVYEWEPSNQLEYLPISWGKLSDMQISGDQLVRLLSVLFLLFCLFYKYKQYLETSPLCIIASLVRLLFQVYDPLLVCGVLT